MALNIAQVFLLADWWVGVVVFIGTLFASRITAMMIVVGSVVASSFALGMGVNLELIYAGFFFFFFFFFFFGIYLFINFPPLSLKKPSPPPSFYQQVSLALMVLWLWPLLQECFGLFLLERSLLL